MSQNLQNHTRVDPLFHFFIIPVLAGNVLARVAEVVRSLMNGAAFDVRSIWVIVVAIATLLAAFKIRLYALKVQDRVIRLEETVRMNAILPEPLRARIGELSPGQFVALRFASDADLTELVRAALDKNLSPKEIKQGIRTWRPDTFRV